MKKILLLLTIAAGCIQADYIHDWNNVSSMRDSGYGENNNTGFEKEMRDQDDFDDWVMVEIESDKPVISKQGLDLKKEIEQLKLQSQINYEVAEFAHKIVENAEQTVGDKELLVEILFMIEFELKNIDYTDNDQVMAALSQLLFNYNLEIKE